MKLIYCRACRDVIGLREEVRLCACGQSQGAYLPDRARAWIRGPCVPLGFANDSFYRALAAQPLEPPGEAFRAFVIERCCKTIEIRGDSVKHDEEQVREAAATAFGTSEAAAFWLSNAQSSLQGRIPLEVIKTRGGIAEVLRVLQLIDYGDPPSLMGSQVGGVP